LSYKILQQKYIADFGCDSSKCIQNCCSIYTIWVDENTANFYREKVPQLFQLLEQREDGKFIIPSNENGCTLLENGLCKIHANYGPNYLPEVCYGYPRAYYKLGDNYFMTSKLLCDYLLKLILCGENPFSWVETEVERIPYCSVEEIPPEKFAISDTGKVIDMYNSLISSIDDDNYNSEEIMIRLVLIANMLEEIKTSDRTYMLKKHLNIVNKEFIANLYRQNNNQFPETFDKLLHILLSVTKNDRSENFSNQLNLIFSFFEHNGSYELKEKWNSLIACTALDKILKTFIKAKLSEYFFPVANWSNCVNDIAIIAANYLIVRLSLILNSEKLDNYNNLEETAKLISFIEPVFFMKRTSVYNNFQKFDINNQVKLVSLLMNY